MDTGYKNNPVSKVSDYIDIRRLEHESRKYLYFGFALAILFHAMLAVMVTFERVEIRVPVPPRTVELRLIELPPTAPYLIRGPRLRRDYLYRRKIANRMPKISGNIPAQPAPFEPHVPDADIDVGIVYRYENLALSEILPDSLFTDDVVSRLPKDTIPFTDRILADTGRYKAEVFIPSGDKKAIQGYVHIAPVYGVHFTLPDSLLNVAPDLARLMNRYSNIEAAVDKPVQLGSSDLFRYPFIVITADAPFELTQAEFDSLARFIRAGGFVIFENRARTEGIDPVGKTIEALMRRVIEEKFLWIRPIENGHSLYHCFFDIDADSLHSATENSSHGRVIGFYNMRQLVALYCPGGFSSRWNEQALSVNSKLGVNLVVYALAQGNWFDADKRLAAFDTSTKAYYQWYENGKMQFRASEWLGVGRPAWMPSPRSVTRLLYDATTKKQVFIYSDDFLPFIKNRKWYSDSRKVAQPLAIINWGDYNIYEGWYKNGQKKFYYNYDDRTYTEWDDFGMVIEHGGEQRSAN